MSPEHYSTQLPTRCLELLDDWWLEVSRKRKPEHGGPLTTTFLLSMSLPIVLLPLERIFFAASDAHTNERDVRPEWARSFREDFKSNFEDAAFFIPNIWSYTLSIEQFNLSQIPPELLQKLDGEAPRKAAAELPISQWSSVIRNALAHGGIAYLDGRGNPAPGATAEMFLFVSQKKKRSPPCGQCGSQQEQLIGLQCLRISVSDFLLFLKAWVAWLKKSGIEKVIDQQPAIAA